MTFWRGLLSRLWQIERGTLAATFGTAAGAEAATRRRAALEREPPFPEHRGEAQAEGFSGFVDRFAYRYPFLGGELRDPIEDQRSDGRKPRAGLGMVERAPLGHGVVGQTGMAPGLAAPSSAQRLKLKRDAGAEALRKFLVGSPAAPAS